MKIALVTETYPPEINGVAMTNQRLARGLLDLGHELLLVKPRRRDAGTRTGRAGFEVAPVPACPIPGYARLRMGLATPAALERLFDETGPDVVHLATEGPLGLAALRAARVTGVPASSTFHTNFHEYCRDYGARPLANAALAYLRWFHNRCAFTTAPDPDLIERLRARGVRRLRRLGRGADLELFHPGRRDPELRRSWGADEATPVAIYVGRAAAEKNIPLALRAWENARAVRPDLKMIVVGDGPARKKLQRRWPGVHFAGMRCDEDLGRHYASADLFLFGSASETFGNVTIEAMASGLAVVAYDYAAARQFVRDGENGFTVPLADENAFIERVARVLSEPGTLPDIRRQARATLENYPWRNTVDRFERMLEQATAKHPVRDRVHPARESAPLPSDPT